MQCICDGDDMNTFGYETIQKSDQNNFTIKMSGNGGFVSVINVR